MAGSCPPSTRSIRGSRGVRRGVRGDCELSGGDGAGECVGGRDGSTRDVGSLEDAARLGGAAGEPIDAGTAADDRGAGLCKRARHPRAQHALARIGGWDGSVPGFGGRGRFRGGAGVGGVRDLRRWAETVGLGVDEAGRCAPGGGPGSARCEHAPVAGDGRGRRDQLRPCQLGVGAVRGKRNQAGDHRGAARRGGDSYAETGSGPAHQRSCRLWVSTGKSVSLPDPDDGQPADGVCGGGIARRPAGGRHNRHHDRDGACAW